jgi:hypothetical protein
MKNYPEPEWNAENMNRKQGDTTFETCGWCAHADCGSCRYGCYLETKCALLEDYSSNELKWDTKCIVKKLSSDDFKSIVRSKEQNIKEAFENIKEIKSQIATLNKLKAKNKPPLCDRRPDFELGETVWVFTNKDIENTRSDDKWHRGKVVSGYRTHDGCVSYVLDDFPESKGGWGCGVGVPCILKDKDYKYFKMNPKDFKDWLDLSDRVYNGKKLPLDKYYEALIK